jgi:hypothetical protein
MFLFFLFAITVCIFCASPYNDRATTTRQSLRKESPSLAQRIIPCCAEIRLVAPTRAAIASVAVVIERQTPQIPQSFLSKHQDVSSKTSGHFTSNSLTFYPKHQDNSAQTP